MKVYWHQCGQHHGNLGDKLTPLLLDYFDVPHEWAPPEKAELFGVGSILGAVPRGYRGIVWSTGALFSEEPHDLCSATVLAVRGKLTLAQLAYRERSGVCLGDGGLLASLIFRPCRKRYKLGVIPHYAQAEDPLFAALDEHPEIKRIDICDEPRSIIQQIGQCECVLSSSLHGLIVADSLGVPNRWIDLPGKDSRILGNGFKFRDYYSILGIEHPQPVLLRSGDNLDRLLRLFEDYNRPGIEDRKRKLLASLRSVVEPRSRLKWDVAKQDIVTRERRILQRLKQHGIGCKSTEGLTERNSSNSERTDDCRSFSEMIAIIQRDSNALGRFVLECLSQIQKLHELGIVHGDIRDENIIIENQRPILANFGWRVSGDDTAGSLHTHHAATDLHALGKLLRDFCQHHPYLKTIAGLLMHSQQNQSIVDAATASVLTQAVAVNVADIPEADDLHMQRKQPPFAKLSQAIRILLERIAAQDQVIAALRSDLESAHLSHWRSDVRLAALELDRAIPSHATYVLIDGDEWRNELVGGQRSLPFLERNGTYWGPPEDDNAAIRELTRLQQRGAEYVVVAKPAFWWLEHYTGFRDSLVSSADCCHKDDLLIVFRLRDDRVSADESG